MGWKRSLAIHFGYWLYLAFGGLVFYFVELPLQGKQITPSSPKSVYGGRADLTHRDVNFCQSLEEEIHRRIYLQQNVSVDLGKTWTTAMKGLVHESCANLTRRRQLDPSLSLTEENQVNPWDYSTAIYLSMTILTTIGYGDYSPLTTGGRIFCIFYGFIGIPITGLFLKTTTDFFSEKLLSLYERQRKKRAEKGKRIFSAAAVFLVPGLIALLFIPAAILTAIEDWNYFDAIYFSFVSLTTIGFGDMTTGKNVKSSLLGFYRICLTSWVLAGIAYWAIVIVFISKAFKFKRVRKRLLLKKEAIERLRSGLLQQQKLAIKDPQSKTTSNIHINNTLPVIDEPTGADGGGGPSGSKKEQDPRQMGFLSRARATASLLTAYMLGRKEAPPVTSNLQDTEMTCQAHSSDRAAAAQEILVESSSAFEELPQSDQKEQQQRQLEMMQKLLSEAMSILEQEGRVDGGGNDPDVRGSSRHRDDEDVERIRFTASS